MILPPTSHPPYHYRTPQLKVSLESPGHGHQTSELKLHWHTFIRFLAVCYQTVFDDQFHMRPAVLNYNWTDVLPCSWDEIDSLFKVKINRPITEDFNRSLAEAN